MEYYFRDPRWRCVPQDEQNVVTAIFRLKREWAFRLSAPYPLIFMLDPTRRLEKLTRLHVFPRSSLVMHHFSFVRADIRRKLLNVSNRGNYAMPVEAFAEAFESWTPARPFVHPHPYFAGVFRGVEVVPNAFGIAVTLVDRTTSLASLASGDAGTRGVVAALAALPAAAVPTAPVATAAAAGGGGASAASGVASMDAVAAAVAALVGAGAGAGAGVSCAASCGRPAVLRCSRCHTAQYCGAGCQKAHWAAHKSACARAAAAADGVAGARGGAAAAASPATASAGARA